MPASSWSVDFEYIGRGGWKGSGGDWGFSCCDCWFHMENLPKMGVEAHGFYHQVKKQHSIIITDPDGNKTIHQAAILDAGDDPPF